MPTEIVKDVVVPCSLDALFDSFATTAGVTTFFAPEAVIEPRVGGAYELYFDADAEPGERGTEGCTVLSIEPPRLLVVQWSFPPHLPRLRRERTQLSLAFSADPREGARVVLAHQGFREVDDPLTRREWEEGYRYFNRVWGTVLARLVSRWKHGPLDWSAA